MLNAANRSLRSSRHPEHREVIREKPAYGEAELLFKRALAIWEQALRPEHPYVDITLYNLAELYRAQGRNDEAERLLREHGQ